MKAIVQDRYGSADVLTLTEVPTPVPTGKSVLLKVRAASVNGLDWHIMVGEPFLLRLLGFGLRRPKQRIRGVDVAGEVVALQGSDSRFRVGDAVFGLGNGSFAEYALADEGDIVSKPDQVTYDVGATLGVAAYSALQAVRDWGKIQPGQSVAITGAGSGVGTFAVQLAKWRGARVTAISSSENVELLRSIGADEVIDHRKEDFTRSAARYDVILDISGRHSTGALRGALKPDGALVIVGGRGGIGRLLAAGLRRAILRQRIVAAIAKVSQTDLAQLGDLVAQGKVAPVIEKVYSLSEVPAAMAQAERHQARGKLLIHVA